MPDLAETRKMAHRIDNVMRRFPLGLVNDEGAVKRCRLWVAWHFRSYRLVLSSERKIQIENSLNGTHERTSAKTCLRWCNEKETRATAKNAPFEKFLLMNKN